MSSIDTNFFIPRLDYSVFILEIPPLSEKDREQAVASKLRGLYPGNLDDKFLVILPNGKRSSYLVFVFNNSLRDDPLRVSTLAAARLCKKGRQNCVIIYNGWLEYLTLDDGKILSSMVTLVEGRPSIQLTANAAKWFSSDNEESFDNNKYDTSSEQKKTGIVIKVFCTASDCPDEETVISGKFIFHYFVLEKELQNIPFSSCACFPGRLSQVKSMRRFLVVAACVTAIIFTLLIRHWYDLREAERAARREEDRISALEAAERRTREEKLFLLMATWEEQLKEQHIGVYTVIETLASCLSPAIRISSASIKEDGSFRLDGISANAISALDDLQNHPDIKNAAIGTIVLDGRQERFTVDGLVKQQPLLPQENLVLDEKIIWYETALVAFSRNEAMPETAAAATQLIRDLLEKSRLRITRFRYLDANDGWVVECAVSGTGIQLVQVIKEVDEMLSMKITSMETRNRQNVVEAVITFHIFGPGGRNIDRDYEDHPSLARIALMYGAFTSSSAVTQAQAILPTTTGLHVTTPSESTLPSLLEYVGYIGIVDGRGLIYVKDTNSGELYRLAEGEGSYSYRINNAGLITAILEGSSSPIAVRRNDGF